MTKRAVFLLSPLFAALLLFTACGRFLPDAGPKVPVATGVPPKGPIRVAMVPRGTTSAYWKSVEAGAKRAADELLVELVWKGPLKDEDKAQQIQSVETVLAEGIHGLGVAPIDGKALLRPIQAAISKKIPVVIFDSALEGDLGRDFLSFIATDNREGGRKAGGEMARLLKGKGRVVMLRSQEGSKGTTEREAGFLEILRRQPDVTILSESQYSGATAEEAQARGELMLEKLQTADGIFTSTESSTAGMLNLLRKHKIGGKKFIGFDDSATQLKSLEEGAIQALLIQNPDRIGYDAVKSLVSAIKGHSVDPRIDTGVALITLENRQSPEIKAMLGEN